MSHCPVTADLNRYLDDVAAQESRELARGSYLEDVLESGDLLDFIRRASVNDQRRIANALKRVLLISPTVFNSRGDMDGRIHYIPSPPESGPAGFLRDVLLSVAEKELAEETA